MEGKGSERLHMNQRRGVCLIRVTLCEKRMLAIVKYLTREMLRVEAKQLEDDLENKM